MTQAHQPETEEPTQGEPSFYVDVHTHLTHERFSEDCEEVIRQAEQKGLGAIVVNGLEPVSNRQILDMAKRHPVCRAALGIYPVDAVVSLLPEDFPFHVATFDVDAEIGFIKTQAEQGLIAAVGECGLDGHWLETTTDAEQERVFCALASIAKAADIPVIVHSRKKELRCLELLKELQVEKVNMHCFSGKSRLGAKYAEEQGWCFSIPANVQTNEGFQALVRRLPPECILTETDAPFLSPVAKTRNVPENVIQALPTIAQTRGWSLEQSKHQIWTNYLRLFGK